MKLISMTDFCLEVLNENPLYNEVKMLTKISNYANFLKQPLHLSMFVPVDEEGNILKDEPEYCFASKGSEHYERHEKYWKAKEKVKH